MESITLNILNINITINGYNITINSKKNVNLSIENDSNLILSDYKNTIKINDFAIAIDDKNIKIHYKNKINVNMINSAADIDIDKEYDKIMNDLKNSENNNTNKNNENNNNDDDDDDDDDKEKLKEKIIKAHKLAKIERIRARGLLYCKTDAEYVEQISKLDEVNKKNIIYINFELKHEHDELRAKMKKIKIYKTNFSEQSVLNIYNKCDNYELASHAQGNICLFSKNEKLQKDLLKYKEKIFNRYTNNELIKNKKRRTYIKQRSPSGFLKPCKITTELRQLLNEINGGPIEIEISRVDAFKLINKYVKIKNLQDKNNRRVIIPDNKLAQLLKLKKDDCLSYFNLNRYLSKHFVK